ncbi:extracellular solute-binding protein [Anoxynatronum sibiricum]|uniref:Extracellular solute-binding protein n=1 Tax=Anoxynatronum sibiricum TaxID=210623 RepID=A0ABU9VP22_9CLOT
MIRKQQWLFYVLVLFLTVTVLTGCGGASEAPEEQQPAEIQEGPAEEAAEQESAVTLEDSLVIYSTHGEEMLALIADGFTEKTGVAVDFINLKGELADRVRAEKENPQADIMFGGPSSLYITMAEEGIFESLEPTWASSIDPIFRDADGRWFGTMQTPVLLFYNEEALEADQVPQSWAALTDPQYEGMIVSRDNVSSSQRAVIVALLDYYQRTATLEEGVDYLKALDRNTKNYYGSGSLHFQSVGRNESPISYGVLSAVMDNRNNNDMPLAIVDAEEGAIVITDAIAAINNAPHPHAAAAFVEYAGSLEVQVLLANEYDRMPTLTEAIEAGPDWMKEPFKAMDVDWGNVAQHELEWLNLWDTEIRDAGKDL